MSDSEPMSEEQMRAQIEDLRAKGAELAAMLKQLEKKLEESSEATTDAEAEAARKLLDPGNSD